MRARDTPGGFCSAAGTQKNGVHFYRFKEGDEREREREDDDDDDDDDM